MRLSTVLAWLLLLACAGAAGAQQRSPAGMDSLLEHLVGRWEMSGTVRGEPATYDLVVTRVLGGRFVELHMTDVHQPPAYEARVFIGVDSARSCYVVHWLDAFGAPYSIPHGVGTATGDTIRFGFAYADGPFRDMFVYAPRTGGWYFRLESGDSIGSWRLFAEYQLRRR